MTKLPTYIIRFALVNPLRLQRTGSVEGSIVYQVYGQVSGSFEDLDGLDPRRASRLIDNNLITMEHTIVGGRRLIRLGTGGITLFYYCSLCGRRFSSNRECNTCKVTFYVTPPESLLGEISEIPRKVVTYAESHRHMFVYEPPSA